jgi:diguanylate cyclase (GGDEF)-like protein
MLSSQLELDILSKNALDSLMQYMHAQAGAILIERQGDLFIGASYNIKDPETLTGNDAVWDSLKTLQRKKLQLDDTIRVEGVLVNFHPRDILIQPIMYKGISLGVIVLASSVLFDEELCSGFEMFSKNLSLALRNAVTYEQLQKLAANDPLTGIYNRRFGMTRLNEEFNRAIRTSSPLGVLIFDIDHFKQVNDTYGHTVGDRVLLSVTQVAKMALRKGDFIIRYGGEEFMIILPGASKEDTVFIAERLRHMVEESSCSHGSQQIKITVSVGATSLPEFSAENESELIQQADEAMYRAKELGRNRVTAV